MNSIETLREFLAWCSIINIGMLLVSTLMLTLMRDWVSRIHAKMTGVSEEALPGIYLQFLGTYTILLILFICYTLSRVKANDVMKSC